MGFLIIFFLANASEPGLCEKKNWSVLGQKRAFLASSCLFFGQQYRLKCLSYNNVHAYSSIAI